ncbi:hypothetical protein ACXYRR_01395 [Mycoplasma sp. 246B]
MYTYQDILDDIDVIRIRSVDVVSVYNAFLKVFAIEVDKNNPVYHEVTWNNYRSNAGFSKPLYRFIFYMFYYLKDFNYIGKNLTREQAFVKIKELFELDATFEYQANSQAENILEQAKQIFRLAYVDGSTKDLLVLVEEFDILKDTDKKQALKKIYFDFEPFNGCDIPD